MEYLHPSTVRGFCCASGAHAGEYEWRDGDCIVPVLDHCRWSAEYGHLSAGTRDGTDGRHRDRYGFVLAFVDIHNIHAWDYWAVLLHPMEMRQVEAVKRRKLSVVWGRCP